MSTPDPMVVAVVTALGLNGKCGERTVHQAFLEGIEQELGCMQVDLYECDQPTRANALGQVCDRISAFLQAEPQIIAYGREFYRGDPSARAAGDAPRSTPPTAPSDESKPYRSTPRDLVDMAQGGVQDLADALVSLQELEEDLENEHVHAKEARTRVVNGMHALLALADNLRTLAEDAKAKAESEATASLASAGLGVSFPRDPATLHAIEAHENRMVEAVTPAIREACEDLGQAMAFLSDSFEEGDEAGALLDLLQRINANVWSARGELAIDVRRPSKPVTRIPDIDEAPTP